MSRSQGQDWPVFVSQPMSALAKWDMKGVRFAYWIAK